MIALKAGSTVPFIEMPPIRREQLREYAEASGDPNPIHLDDEVAKKMGLPGIIAHGMLSAAFLAERARRFMEEEADGGREWRLSRIQTRFKGMVFPGDVISIGGTVKDLTPEALTLELQARNAKGELTTLSVGSYSRRGA